MDESEAAVIVNKLKTNKEYRDTERQVRVILSCFATRHYTKKRWIVSSVLKTKQKSGVVHLFR